MSRPDDGPRPAHYLVDVVVTAHLQVPVAAHSPAQAEAEALATLDLDAAMLAADVEAVHVQRLRRDQQVAWRPIDTIDAPLLNADR